MVNKKKAPMIAKPSKTFGEYVEEQITKEKNDWHKPTIGIIHASSLGYIHTGKSAPKDFFNKSKPAGRMVSGSAMHSYLGKLFRETEIPISIEVDRDLKIIGRVDLLTPKGELADIKSVERFPEKPYPEHIIQLSAYMVGMGKTCGWLFYVSKIDYFKSKDFKVEFDKELWEQVLDSTRNYHLKVKQLYGTMEKVG